MSRKSTILTFFAALTGSVTAQITSRGYGNTHSLPELLSHLFGIEFYNPYEALGFASTLGVLWISTYVIFKVGIKRIDEGLDNDGVSSKSGIADALGVENDKSRNVLAIVTLLIVLSMMGTGAFYGIINGWRTLILLAFTISILAGLIFVLVGGAGGIIGGAKLSRGLGKQVEARGVEEMAEAEERIAEAEERLLEAEKKAQEDYEEGNEEKADQEIHYDEEQLEGIIETLEDGLDNIENLTAEEIEDLGNAIKNLENLVELLDLGD